MRRLGAPVKSHNPFAWFSGLSQTEEAVRCLDSPQSFPTVTCGPELESPFTTEGGVPRHFKDHQTQRPS